MSATATKEASIVGPKPYSADWYALRKFNPDRPVPVVIGASDAAAACNVSPYSSPLQLYLEMRGEMDDGIHDDETQERLAMGKRLEPVILDIYAEKQNCNLQRDVPMHFSATDPFMAATPDALATDVEFKTSWSVDAKSTNWRMLGGEQSQYGEDGTDEIPVTNLCQAQQQMHVMGLDRCDFPVLIDGRRFRVYRVDRNDDLINNMRSAEKELVERVIDGNPPEPTWSHSGTKRCLDALYGCEIGTVAILEESMLNVARVYKDLGGRIKALENEREELRNKLVAAMEDAESAEFAGIADWKLKRSMISDTFVTQEDVVALQAKVGQVKRRGYQRLTVKGPKAK